MKQASSNASDKSPMKVEGDAWYVDLPQQSACERPSVTTPPLMSTMGDMSGAAAFADPSEPEMRQTVSEALTNGAKAAMEQLTRKK